MDEHKSRERLQRIANDFVEAEKNYAEMQQECHNLRGKLAARDAEIRELQATLADLRHAAAPGSTDNGDGTTTWQGVPVTIPTGITPTAVRAPKDGERVMSVSSGVPLPASGNFDAGAVRVILADPATAVTWQAPACLKDGEYTIDSDGDLWLPYGNGEHWIVSACGCAKPGRYKVIDGVGTWIGEA